MAQHDDKARRLMQLAGIGATTASAIVASVGNGLEFKSSSQFSAWLGLTPGQHSSGGKARLGRITKAGDSYLRSLLILGARPVLNVAASKSDPVSRWAIKVQERRGYWRAVVAIASGGASDGRSVQSSCLAGRSRESMSVAGKLHGVAGIEPGIACCAVVDE